MRAELGRLRALDKLTKEGFGLERYSEEIRTFEEAIASDEREIDALAKSIGDRLGKHDEK